MISIIYMASTEFITYQNGVISTNHYPTVSTNLTYKSLEAFLDLCELKARQNPDFKISKVQIGCNSVKVYPDGTLENIEHLQRIFTNV